MSNYLFLNKNKAIVLLVQYQNDDKNGKNVTSERMVPKKQICHSL